MDNIIKDLLEIEEKAHEIARVSREKVTGIKALSKKDTEEAIAQIEASKNAKLDEIRVMAQEELVRELARLKLDLDEKMFHYEAAFNKDLPALAQSIFNKIINS